MKPRVVVMCAVSLFACAASASAATQSWTGAVSNLWSVGGNWNGGVAPVSGDSLLFPAGAMNLATNNDLSGLSLQSISIARTSDFGGYSFSGNAITLSGGITDLGFTTWSIPTTLSASQTFLSNGSQDTYGGTIDLNGQTLTITPYNTTLSASVTGTGAVMVNGVAMNVTGSLSFSGTFTLSGAMNVSGTIANATLTASSGSRLSGNGTLAATTLNGTTLSVGNDPGGGCCADPDTTGILSTGNLSIQGGTVRLDLINPTPGTGYDQIQTTGTVTLNNPTLQIVLPGALPVAGQTFTIINNDGSDAVVGTFAGLPEGATFTVSGVQFRISYSGGTGNDAVLTSLFDTTTTITSSKNPVLTSESFTLTAHVQSAGGTPAGTVSFIDGVSILGTAMLDGSGNAAITVQLPEGSHSIVARYNSAGVFAPSTAPPLTEPVIGLAAIPTLSDAFLLMLAMALAGIAVRVMRLR